MSNSKILNEGLTYEDVLLIPNYSDILPQKIQLKTRFSKNIDLNIPIVSAAMDTVTESKMAIAVAREGGIGVIHKNLSIQDQSNEIRLVKRSESGMIIAPVTLKSTALVKDAKNNMKKYKIGGIPIISDKGKLKGIVTNRDLRFERDDNKPISKVMTSKNLITVKSGTSLDDAEEILQKHKIEKLPVVDSRNNLVGLITFRDINKHSIKPISNKDDYGRLRVAAAIGIDKDLIKRSKELINAGADALVIDTAHAHSKSVADALKKVKDNFDNIDVVVGNIATAEAAEFLINIGAILL